jgi:hypothetical protein
VTAEWTVEFRLLEWEDGLATARRAERVYALASEVRKLITGRFSRSYERICSPDAWTASTRLRRSDPLVSLRVRDLLIATLLTLKFAVAFVERLEEHISTTELSKLNGTPRGAARGSETVDYASRRY